MTHAYKPSTQKEKARRSGVQGPPELHEIILKREKRGIIKARSIQEAEDNEFQTSQGYSMQPWINGSQRIR